MNGNENALRSQGASIVLVMAIASVSAFITALLLLVVLS
jgi:hypothetical protein